jgi:membrane protease YdiL (CAAX protease family)
MSTITTTLRPTPRSLRQVAARHPVLYYFILAFVLTWAFILPMLLGQDGLGIFPYRVPESLYLILFICASFAGPTLSAVLLTAAVDGKAGLRVFFRRYAQWRVGWRWHFVGFLAYPLLYLGAAMLYQGMAPLQSALSGWTAFFTVYLPALLIIPGILTWGEEPGWRGFALTRLQENKSPLIASLLVGFMHAIWHLPAYFLISGPVAAGPFDPQVFLLNTANIMAITFIWTWIFNNASQSILIAFLVHSSSNATLQLMRTWLPNYPVQAIYTVMAFYYLAALLLIVFTKGRLGYQRRSKSVEETSPIIPMKTGDA